MSSEVIKIITNKVLELVMVEINKADMQENIRSNVIHPLLFMIYKQLYPYIYGFLGVIFLMFVMLVALLVFFIVYLKK
jgi:hypothetical protein